MKGNLWYNSVIESFHSLIKIKKEIVKSLENKKFKRSKAFNILICRMFYNTGLSVRAV